MSETEGGMTDLEQQQFQLLEQVQDLKQQLEQKTTDHGLEADKLQARIAEQSDKLKRMKEIFGQTTRTIDRLRTTNQSQQGEIRQLKTQLNAAEEEKEQLSIEHDEQEAALERLKSEKSHQTVQLADWEKKHGATVDELDRVQKEYEQYKKRAHKLLERNKEQMNASLGPEAIEKKVREIKEKYETERAQKSEQQLVLERDLRKAIDHINLLEAGQAGLVKEKSASEMALARLRQSSIQAQARHEATLALNDQSLAQLKKAHQTTLDALQTQLAWLENENKRLIQAAQEPVLPSPPALADLERQKQELQLLLKDAQADNKLLRHQERIAKSELRKLNTADKKQNMNTEYLKNVLLKFLMSENKQTMVPIIAKLLSLDETETANLTHSCV